MKMRAKRKEQESKWFLNVMGHVMFTSAFLVSTSGRGLEELPKPENVHVNSINMRHILRWSSVRVPLGEVSYSVQFQGEFERNHRKTWVAITECSSITETWCDVTADISSDVGYDLKVRTELGNVTSEWANLNKLFNRKETNLTAPTLIAGVSGDWITLNVSEIKKNINANIYYWKEGVEQQVMNVSLDKTQIPYYLSVEKGVLYCFQAQLYILEYNKFSSFSDKQCETVSNDTMSKGNLVKIATALLLGVCFLAASLFCIGRFCWRTRPVWFPQVSAPYVSNFENLQGEVLKEDYSQETCDTVEVWQQSETLLDVHESPTARERINSREGKEGGRPMNSAAYGEVSQPQRSMQITYQKGCQSQIYLGQ